MKAFTLIELLIVVAIIAILAAIAVPNFLEAQIRAKVSRCKSDMRTLVTGLETYAADANRYPAVAPNPVNAGPEWSEEALSLLSTPIAYLTTAKLVDLFVTDVGSTHFGYVNWKSVLDPIAPGGPTTLDLMAPASTPGQRDMLAEHRYMVASRGPDRLIEGEGPDGAAGLITSLTTRTEMPAIYDPTNGTVSRGDLLRTAKGIIN